MAAVDDGSQAPAQPDYALIMAGRMGDGGPRYTETPADPTAPGAPIPAEPWNTITASFFILIAVWWAWRLRGRYRQYPFLVGCMPILLAGGIGGTLYHGLRTSKFYFYLDIIPISTLGIAGSVFLALKAWQRRGWLYLAVALAAYVALSGLLFKVIAPLPIWNRLSIRGGTVAVNVSYASLAIVVIIPLAGMLIRTRFRHIGWVAAGLASFGIGWFFRLVDERIGPYLAMGSHWLWHTFGALATAFLIEYFYRVERDVKPPPSMSE